MFSSIYWHWFRASTVLSTLTKLTLANFLKQLFKQKNNFFLKTIWHHILIEGSVIFYVQHEGYYIFTLSTIQYTQPEDRRSGSNWWKTNFLKDLIENNNCWTLPRIILILAISEYQVVFQITSQIGSFTNMKNKKSLLQLTKSRVRNLQVLKKLRICTWPGELLETVSGRKSMRRWQLQHSAVFNSKIVLAPFSFKAFSLPVSTWYEIYKSDGIKLNFFQKCSTFFKFLQRSTLFMRILPGYCKELDSLTKITPSHITKTNHCKVKI